METEFLKRRIRELFRQWFPSLTRDEWLAFDIENAEINTRRIFFYSILGIAVSICTIATTNFVFKERDVYRYRSVYFDAVVLFHSIHIAILALYIVIYRLLKRLTLQRGTGFTVKKILVYVSIAALNLNFTYLVVMSQHYHSDLVFFAVSCITIAVAIYIRIIYRILIFTASAMIVSAGIGQVIADTDLVIIKTVNVIIIAFISIGISFVINGFRLREFLNMRNLKKTNAFLVKDLVHARDIQRRIIPAAPPHVSGAVINSLYKPMELMGGDYFDYIGFQEKDSVGVFISDVSGHGVSASLITSIIKTLIDTADDEKLHPGNLLHYINSRSVGLMAGNFVTALYGIIDTEKMELAYARGGHTYPVLMREGGIKELTSRGIFIGVKKDLSFEERKIELRPGDKIFFYTDGLTEARDSRGRLFEEAFMNDILPWAARLYRQNFVEYIYRELVKFAGHEEFDDDICMVGIELDH